MTSVLLHQNDAQNYVLKKKNISKVDLNSGFWERMTIIGNWFSSPTTEIRKKKNFWELIWLLCSFLCEYIGITVKTLVPEHKLTNLVGIFMALTCLHYQDVICILRSVKTPAAILFLDLKISYNDANWIFFYDQNNIFLKPHNIGRHSFGWMF